MRQSLKLNIASYIPPNFKPYNNNLYHKFMFFCEKINKYLYLKYLLIFSQKTYSYTIE